MTSSSVSVSIRVVVLELEELVELPEVVLDPPEVVLDVLEVVLESLEVDCGSSSSSELDSSVVSSWVRSMTSGVGFWSSGSFASIFENVGGSNCDLMSG